MARISEAELERLKRAVSVERLAERAGVKLQRRGKDLTGLCPMHRDTEPSLVISPEKNLWHCLGACQAGGSAIDWVMRNEGVSFRRAVELLQTELGEAPEPVSQVWTVQAEADRVGWLRRVTEYYHATLKQSPEALAYLAKRGLKDAEMIARFRLGYANRTLGYRLPERNVRAGQEVRAALIDCGILRASGHEHFTGSLVIPIIDEHGIVTGLYGRKLLDNLRAGTPKHLYLPGPHRGVWNSEALQASREIILCESLIDALTFWGAGFRNVTASYGVAGFTADHLEAFKRSHTERVLIAYDGDEAGHRAAEQLAGQLAQHGIASARVRFPLETDANAYAVQQPPAQDSLGALLRHAEWLAHGPRRESITTTPEQAAADPAVVAEAAEAVPADTTKEAPSVSESALRPPPSARPDALFPFVPEAAGDKVEVRGEEVFLDIGDRRYRARGVFRNQSLGQMKVNLLGARGSEFHGDTLDVCVAYQRNAYSKAAAPELGLEAETIGRDLKRVLFHLEAAQDEAVRKQHEAKAARVRLSPDEERAALALLRDPQLMNRILADFVQCGVVGEESNKLTSYLAAVSRKLERPLAVLIQSSSAAGKSALMEAVLSLMPEEETVKYSAMTGQSLFYLEGQNLQHKILAIAEEAGAQRAAYALKLLQSEGELTIASTGKDANTGRLITHEYRVSGPVMIFSTTTEIEIDEELLNRCLVLSVDEDREQTRAIHRQQRESRTLEGRIAQAQQQAIRKLHQNAQRLLQPLIVVNPYARDLTFLDDRTRMRRDHTKYLELISAVALLHQYQRASRCDERLGEQHYIEVTLEDIAWANRLASETLGRCLDELPPQTRRLLLIMHEFVTEQCTRLKIERSEYRFTRKQVREKIGWSNTLVTRHLDRLAELEYVLIHRGGRGQSFVYELLYDGEGQDGASFLMGLLDVNRLKQGNGTTKSLHPRKPGSHTSDPGLHPQNTGFTPGLHGDVTTAGTLPSPINIERNGKSEVSG